MPSSEPRKQRNPIEELAQQASSLQKQLRSFDTLFRRGASPAELSGILRKLEESIEKLTLPTKETLREALVPARQQLHQRSQDFALNFGERLYQLLTAQGMQAEMKLPYIYLGLYTLKLSEDYSRAEIAFSMNHILEAIRDATPEKIVKALLKVRQRIEGRKFDPEVFAKRLYEAYQRTSRILGKREGEKVPIVDVMLQYTLLSQPASFQIDPSKEHFQDYGWAPFAYDLYRLNQSTEKSVKTVHGKRWRLFGATQDLTRDKRKFIWVPTLIGSDGKVKGEPFGYLAFE